MEPTTGTPTTTIEAEMNAVLQQCVRVAADYLTRFDTFTPFAVLYRPDDQLEQIEVGRTDGSADVASQDAYEALVASLGERAGELHAIGVVADVELTQEAGPAVEAVRVELEHHDAQGRVLTVLVSYERTPGAAPTFAEEPSTADGVRRFWV